MTYSPSAFSAEIREFSPSLLPWGGFGPLIARMIQAHDQLASRVLLAPPKWLHIVSIYLWKNQGRDIHEMARAVYDKHPRELFNECWADADPKLYPVLKRCGRKALLLEQYEQLNTVLGSHVADIVTQTKVLSAARIDFFFRILDLDPLIAPAYRLLNFDQRAAQNFDAMLRHMRSLNLIGDHDAEAKALRNGVYKSITHYVEARLARVKAPVNLNLKPPLRQIVTGEELSFIALKWQNCLRAPTYRIELGLGSKLFILMDNDEDSESAALASFEWTAFGWHMDECEMPGKRQAPDEIRQRMVKLLETDGVNAEANTCAGAFLELDRCPEPPSWDEAWDWQHKDAD